MIIRRLEKTQRNEVPGLSVTDDVEFITFIREKVSALSGRWNFCFCSIGIRTVIGSPGSWCMSCEPTPRWLTTILRYFNGTAWWFGDEEVGLRPGE